MYMEKERAGSYETVESPEEHTGWSTTPEAYQGYRVLDARGRKIGRVEELLMNRSNEPMYVSVKIGLLRPRSVLIPVQEAWLDEKRQTLLLNAKTVRARRGT